MPLKKNCWVITTLYYERYGGENDEIHEEHVFIFLFFVQYCARAKPSGTAS